MEELKFQELVLKQLELLTSGQNKMQGDITDMRSDITDIRGDITDIRGDITDIRGDITNIRGDITNIRGDITNIRRDITGMQGDISSMQGEISSMKVDITDLRQGMVRMENDLSTKITALFDAREAQQEFNERILSSVERLEAKVDVLQLETAYYKKNKITGGSFL